MIEDGLHARLTADSGFAAIAGDRLYPVVLPETMLNPDATVPPAATYQVISQIPEYTLDGALGMVTARIQIDAWCSSYAGAKALAGAIRAALDDFSGVLPDGDATQVQNLWRENAARDDFDRDARLYRVSADYRVIYAEPVASAAAANGILADTVSGLLYRLIAASGALSFAPYSGSLPSTPLLLRDTVTAVVYAVTVASGALQYAPASGTGVSSLALTDSLSGATATLAISDGALTLTT